MVVGYGITAISLRPETKIGLTLGPPARLYLDLSFRLSMDDENTWLTVVSSFVGLLVSVPSAGANDPELHELLHYDYERSKALYTSAHLQVSATSDAWVHALGPSGRALERLHLPVGGVRFRPTLEDVIELVGDHELVQTRPNWKQAVDEGREKFWGNQLRAAIRRRPDIAREVLETLPLI